MIYFLFGKVSSILCTLPCCVSHVPKYTILIFSIPLKDQKDDQMCSEWELI